MRILCGSALLAAIIIITFVGSIVFVVWYPFVGVPLVGFLWLTALIYGVSA